MNTRKKAVLLFQPSRFQAEVWRSILWEHNIVVIWEENYTNKQLAQDYLTTLELNPNLLIIDLTIDNAYEICRCFHQYYPSSKIILTADPQEGYSSAIRRWAAHQGVDELLINFQKENLFTQVNTNINSVLRLLEYSSTKPENLARALNSIKQKNISIPQATIPVRPPLIFIGKSEQATATTISPMVRMSFFVVILLLITVILDSSTLFLISPVQGLQGQMSVDNNNEKSTTSNKKLSTIQEIETVPQGIFNYGGSTTWTPIRNIVNAKIVQEYPELNLRYLPAIDTTPGSGTGIRMLLEGDLDFAYSSRPLEQQEHILARQQGFTLKEYHIAIDAIAIAVHPSLEISGLTVEQLKKIYLGEITNWKEVNGPDLKIIPFSRNAEDGGTARFFEHHVLHDQPFSNNVQYVYSITDGLKQLKNTPGGIYYGSASQIVPQCSAKSLPIANNQGRFIPLYVTPVVPPENCPQQRNQINLVVIEKATYPLTRYLSVIVKQDGGRAQQAGEIYSKMLLTKEIQKLIKEIGFVPIN